MYGAKFSKEYGSEPNETWQATIAQLTDEQIQQALKTLAEQGGPFAPSLGEFVKASKPPKPETGSPRYLGANPINYTEARIAGLLPQPEKKHFDMEALRKCLKG
jgi:hypothetical protein